MKERYLYTSKYLLFLAVLSVAVVILQATHAQSREYLLKAGYIEKFTHFVEWPEPSTINSPTAAFTIAIIGENKLEDAIEKIFNGTKIDKKEVRIASISSVEEIDNCSMLIITESEKHNLAEILRYTAGKPILTIGDTKGYGKRGVMINMFIDNNYLRYEINRDALDKSGLKISSLLLTSAVIVKTDE